MAYDYYFGSNPAMKGYYPDSCFNPALDVECFWGQKEVFDGWRAYGRVTYASPLSDKVKKLYGLFDVADACSNKKLDKRVAKIAKKVEHKIGIPFEVVYDGLRPILAGSEGIRSMSNKEIAHYACLGYLGIKG